MTTSRPSILKFMLTSFGTLSAVTVGSAYYALQIEPKRVNVKRLTIPLRRLPPLFDGFSIAHITDLHFGGWMNGERMTALAARINALKPDVVAITGDFASRINTTIARQLTDSLRELDAREGAYAVLGNHDHWTDVQAVSDAIREAGIQLMLNQSAMIERDGQHLVLAGVDDIWENRQDLDAALNGVSTDSCIILLAHEPDYADEVVQDGRVDLQLSGHSHGGQIRLPFIGALVLPVLAKNYNLGLYTIQDLKLYVNPGLGMLDPPVRFLCPSEITHITLRSTR